MRLPLDVFFRPRNVAIIGATDKPGSVGRSLVENLSKGGFQGSIFPVNPTREAVLGLRCYNSLAQLPEEVDLAVIATPAVTVPGVIEQCAEAGAEGAIIISAGFREVGEPGRALERQVLEKRGKMRIIGPNCLGLMNPHLGLNATFARSMARPGNIGLISQSGAMCTAILDWSQREMMGFSAFISVGSMIDVNWGDLIQYLGDDPATVSIIIYMESVGDARAFLSAAREVSLTKPIILIKPGRTAAAAKAAASHTGALTGSDEVLDAAFRRCGVLRVNTIAELFYLSEALSKQPRPKGPRLTIVTNAGGPGVLATDSLLSRGGQLAELSPKTRDALNQVLTAHWSHENPIDILGDAAPASYAAAVQLAAKDPGTDGLLVILSPQSVTEPALTATEVAAFAHLEGKPIIASWMGGAEVAAGEDILNRAGIPTYSYPDSAAGVFHSMWQYTDNLRALYETPEAVEYSPAREEAASIIAHVRESGRALLTEAESKRLLAAYGIPTIETAIAVNAAEAVEHAVRIGYPVVLKLHSETITHKTDVGGVRLNLKDAASVVDAFAAIQAGVQPADFLGVTVQPMVRAEGYELILGSSLDSQFGPVLLFGTGGQLVEVYQDRALGLPPLTTTLARRMIERTKIFTALKGVRGRPPVDLVELERILVRFSYLISEQHWIREMDINPLLASSDRFVALDARVVLYSPETREADLPRPAIRPYPTQYVKPWKFENGEQITIRPIRPEDEPLIVRFHGKLSERSVFLRYFYLMDLDDRVAHTRLIQQCFIDYDRVMALVAERWDRLTGDPELMAVARMTKSRQPEEAEFAILIVDEFQGRGLGTEMVRRLIDVAQAEGIRLLTADLLFENHHMQQVCQALGFTMTHSPEDGLIRAELKLEPAGNNRLAGSKAS